MSFTITKSNIIEAALQLFVGADEIRPQFHHPFIENGWACATDIIFLLYFPSSLLDAEVDFPKHPKMPSIAHLIPTEHENYGTFAIEDIQIAVNQLMEMGGIKDTVCPDCAGSGTVEYKFTTKKGYEHKEELECPECEGGGEIAIEGYLNINGVCFSASYFDDILGVAEKLKISSIRLICKNRNIYTFAFGEGFIANVGKKKSSLDAEDLIVDLNRI